MIGHVQLSLLIMGGGHWVMANYNLFTYLLDFAENWLRGVYVCQDDTCNIISQSDYPFKSYDQTSKCSIYVYHCMRLIRIRMKIWLRNTLHLGVVTPPVQVRTVHV